MIVYQCSNCGMTNAAINDLTGAAHTRTGGKPSGCAGTWQPTSDQEGLWLSLKTGT